MDDWTTHETDRLPWEPPTEADEIAYLTYEVCPTCEVKGVYKHAKLICPTCHTILQNCCGD